LDNFFLFPIEISFFYTVEISFISRSLVDRRGFSFLALPLFDSPVVGPFIVASMGKRATVAAGE